MASREKRTLASSKLKQKANNDNGPTLPANQSESSSASTASKKTNKSLHPSAKSQQLASEILEAVATGNQLSAKLEASLPRKRALQTALKRKQKAKKTLIKVKQKVPIKPPLKRAIGVAAAKTAANKKKPVPQPKAVIKKENIVVNKAVARGAWPSASSTDSGLNTSNESDESKKSKTAKRKGLVKIKEEFPIDQNLDNKPSAKIAISPKPRASPKTPIQKQRNSKERDIIQKTKLRSVSKEPEEPLLLNIKTEPLNDSYEDTIEEVIQSSMLVVNPQVVKEEGGGDEPKARRQLVRNPVAAKRGLRNGKLRRADIKTEIEVNEEKSLDNMSGTEVEGSVETEPTLDNDIVLKSETSESTPASNHVNESQEDLETNNNGLDSPSTEPGPKLRSKTKTRNSDSGCSDAEVSSEKATPAKTEAELKKEKALAKFAEMKVVKAVANSNSPKNRRSSLNLEIPRRPSLSEKLEASGNHIDEMINKIKMSIAQEIENQMSTDKVVKLFALRKSFEVERRASVDSSLNDGTPNKIDNSKAKENFNPNDTAKETEKLVKGDSKPAETLPLTDNETEQQTKAATADDVVAEKESTVEEDGNKVSNNVEILVTKEEIVLPPIEVKTTVRRKSVRCSRPTAKVAHLRAVSNPPEVSNDSKVSENDSKLTEKSIDLKSEVKVSSQKESEEITENKPVEISKDEEIQSAIEDEKDEKDEKEEKEEKEEKVSEESKPEDTFESLTRDLEMLVEDSNDKTVNEVTENDNSDVEMRLMIDEDVSQTVSEKAEEVQSKDDCDVKSSNESADSTKMEIDEEPSVGSSEVNAEKSIENLEDSSDISKGANDEPVTDNVESTEEVKNKRVLRTRGDKQKKVESVKPVPSVDISPQCKSEEKVEKPDDTLSTPEVPSPIKINKEIDDASGIQTEVAPNESTKLSESPTVVKSEPVEEAQAEPQVRTRRTREAKKSLTLIQTPVKSKKGKKAESKKLESPQNKEETLLDNEVAEINENNQTETFEKSENILRGVSENAQKIDIPDTKSRSKSENDVGSTSEEIVKPEDKVTKTDDDKTVTDAPKVEPKESTSKDTDEASTSSESCSTSWKIQETPEERANKEKVLSLLGLESWEKANERKKKEQQEQQYTGSLKTVIKLQKDKDGKKKKSKSPLRMVIKHQSGKQGDGEENLEFYIQKEDGGQSCSGESSSGANRKLSTNPQHTSDEDDENSPTKGRQSLVIPEKSSSFSIHPGRLCADNCCYCHGKFGSLDTPMHLAQMKSEERKQRILNVMKHLTKDSCLCDACYRHVDRKVHCSPTSQLKPQRQNRQSMYPCSIVKCTEPARHHLKRRWLCKIKANVKNLDINWETGQHNLLTFCNTHYALIEQILTCTLCRKRLSKNFTFPVGLTPEATEQLNQRLQSYGIPASMDCSKFVCKLCRFFMKLHVKNADVESMTEANQEFHRKYRKKLLYCNELDVPDSEEELETHQQVSKAKDFKDLKSRPSTSSCSPPGSGVKKSKSNSHEKLSKSSDNLDNQSTASEKSRPGTPKTDTIIQVKDGSQTSVTLDSRGLSIEGAIEKLKKRKAIDTTATSVSILKNSKDLTAKNVVDLLSLDKEVTLTRVAKRPRLENNISVCNNDITPVVQRLGANPSISVRTLFPGEEEMNLHANVEFNNVREITPQGWEKCATMIQYDRDTKLLWQELQRPYGNQSSFLRHLILLEKYYRSGDLILAPNASRNAINYSTSVQNRLISYEGPEKSPDEPIVQISTIPETIMRRGYSLDSSKKPTNISTLNTSSLANITAQLSRLDDGHARVMKLTPGVSIVKKNALPNLHRLNTNNTNGSAKRKETMPVQKFTGGNTSGASGKVFQLTEPDFKRLQTLKRQKVMHGGHLPSPQNNAAGTSYSTPTASLLKPQNLSQYQKTQIEKTHSSQFQKHLRMQQEMLNQRSRGDFEPLICDVRSIANENAPNTQNLISTLNLPKSIQITAKGPSTVVPSAASMPIPILPKIPKSLTVIPQTVSRDK